MANVTENVNPEPQIEGEVPEPQISGTQAGQSLGQAGDSAVTLEAVEKLIQKEVQSIKDTRLGKHGTRLDDLEEAVKRYDALQDSGLSKGEALGKMQGDQELSDIKAQLASLLGGDTTAVSAGAGAQSWAEKQASILSDAGLEPNDSRLTELLKSKTYVDYDEYLEDLRGKTFDWKQADAKKPQPSSSTVAQTVPSVVPQAGDFDDYSDDQIGDKMVELLKEPSKHKKEIDLLDAELARRDAKK